MGDGRKEVHFLMEYGEGVLLSLSQDILQDQIIKYDRNLVTKNLWR
jgi:hypothetical protein